MQPNGPAIKGVCVTRRKHRAESWFFSHKIITVQGGYGAFFAVRVQIIWTIRVSRYRVTGEQVTSQGIQSFIESSGAIRICPALRNYLGSMNKSKKCDKQMQFIVRVSGSFVRRFVGSVIFRHKQKTFF